MTRLPAEPGSAAGAGHARLRAAVVDHGAPARDLADAVAGLLVSWRIASIGEIGSSSASMASSIAQPAREDCRATATYRPVNEMPFASSGILIVTRALEIAAQDVAEVEIDRSPSLDAGRFREVAQETISSSPTRDDRLSPSRSA